MADYTVSRINENDGYIVISKNNVTDITECHRCTDLDGQFSRTIKRVWVVITTSIYGNLAKDKDR